MGLYDNYTVKEWLARAYSPGINVAVSVICPDCLKPIAPFGQVQDGNCQCTTEEPGDIIKTHGLEGAGLEPKVDNDVIDIANQR